MEISHRIDQVIGRFNQHSGWEDKYREIIKFGKESKELDESARIDKFKIKGCQSQVWLKPTYQNGQVMFEAASDAILVRGIISIVVSVYSNSTPNEVIETKPEFLQEIGITEHLSLNRTNGLASMIKQVQMYGLVFKSLYDQGVMSADNI